MVDWAELLLQVLKQLGAGQTMTRGAILRQKLDELALAQGTNLGEHLRETNQRFVDLLARIPGVVIHRRPGTDMYVGLQGASWPSVDIEEARRFRRSGLRFRRDVYDALTKISDRAFYYIPSRDEFTQETSDEDVGERIALPRVTLDSLLDERREFAAQRSTEESKNELLRATDHSANPLAEFQASILRQRLGPVWHQYNASVLKRKLEVWASGHNIEIPSSWIVQESVDRRQETSQNLLARFSGYMTDEEVRATMVPFRAVEAMYNDLARQQKRSTD